METLVTGGNGFVGHHLIRALVDRGDNVCVLALPEEDVSALNRLGVSTLRGDVRLPASLRDAFQGVDVVVHLAAMMHVWRPLADYRHVNVEGTVNVCKAAMSANVERVVHMSSSSVYGTGWRGLVDETFPLQPFRDPYSVTKAEGDLAVQRLIEREQLSAVVIRPDQIFGPGDRLHFGKTADRLRAGRGVVVGRGDNHLPLVHVADVVRALLLAIDRDDAIGGVFNITNDAPLTQSEFLETVALATGGRAPRIHVPEPALYLAALGAERFANLTGGAHRPPITRLGVAFLSADVRFSVAKARRVLGFEPRVDLREGIFHTGRWYLADVAGLGDVGLAPVPTPAPTAGAAGL
jgi:dihydroflavonol-4-reductase